jgi:hypothetical protein
MRVPMKPGQKYDGRTPQHSAALSILDQRVFERRACCLELSVHTPYSRVQFESSLGGLTHHFVLIGA